MVVRCILLIFSSLVSHWSSWFVIVLATGSLWCLWALFTQWLSRKQPAILGATLSLLIFYFSRIYFMYHTIHFPAQWLVTPVNMSGDGNMALLPSITSGPWHNTERNELFLLQAVEQISSNSLSCLICSLMLKEKMGPGSIFHLHIYCWNR